MSLILALRRQRQVDFYEFKAILVYRANSRTARAVTQRIRISKNYIRILIKDLYNYYKSYKFSVLKATSTQDNNHNLVVVFVIFNCIGMIERSAAVYMWRSEKFLRHWFFPSGLYVKCLYSLSHLTGPNFTNWL